MRSGLIQDVIVESEADQYAVLGEPVKVSITITHKNSLEVDPSSFKLGEDPLKVEFLKEVKLSERSDLIITIYTFTLEPKKKGLNFLPPISVTVAGKEYSSNESTYEVD